MAVADQTSRLGLLLGGGATKSTASGTTSFHFATLDMDDPGSGPQMLPLGFLAHGVTPSPNRAGLFLLFEKHGPGCAALDLIERRVLASISTVGHRQFYGHGAFSPDGSLLYCTETDVSDRMRGYIAVRDGKDFHYLGDFPTHGVAPHDCILRDGGKTLVVTNGGSAIGEDQNGPSVTWVDVESGKLVRREPVSEARLNAGHLAMTSDGALAVVSAPREGLPVTDTGGISMRGADGTLTAAREPEEITSLMKGETLSVAIHEPTRLVGATNPEGHIVTFWDLDTGRFVRSLRIPSPRGICVSLDGREFIVTFGGTAKAARIDVEHMQPVDVAGNRDGYLCAVTGSHITVSDKRVVVPV